MAVHPRKNHIGRPENWKHDRAGWHGRAMVHGRASGGAPRVKFVSRFVFRRPFIPHFVSFSFLLFLGFRERLDRVFKNLDLGFEFMLLD